MSDAPLRLVACSPAAPLASRVAERLDAPLVPCTETWFACGEGKFVVDDNVRGADVFVFQQVVGPGDGRSLYDRTMMLLHAVEACAIADAASVTAVVPYMPGARQDKRKGRTREGITAGLFARFLQSAGAKRVVAVEIHNEAIGGMFHPGRCRLENLQLYPSLGPWLRTWGLQGDVVAAPDVGGLERARFYAEDLHEGLVAVSKVRDYTQANTVVSSTLIGDVAGKDVLLVDDIIDTAGSVVGAVDALKEGGAKDITVACAHPVFSGPAWERLAGLAERAAQDGWRFKVVGTSSVDWGDAPAWYASFDLAPLLARAIHSMHGRLSVTAVQRGDGA